MPPVPGPNQEQYPAPPPSGPTDDPYRFIMEPPKKQKRAKLPGVGGNPFLTKIIFVLAVVMVVIIAAAVVINVVFGSKTNVSDIISITQTEQEIIRIGSTNESASSQTIKNAAVTATATLTTHQQEWINFLAKRGHKSNKDELKLKESSSTDQQLAQAKQTSTFDIAYSQVMRNQLQDYATALKNAYTNATNTTEKSMLAKQYNEVQILLEQWPASASAAPTP